VNEYLFWGDNSTLSLTNLFLEFTSEKTKHNSNEVTSGITFVNPRV